MVSQHPQQPEVMKMRLAPRAPQGQPPRPPHGEMIVPGASVSIPAAPPWNITIPSSEGGPPLLVMREENGLLVVEGDESRWDEAAKRFLHGMMQWAGQASITWKDEVRKAGEAR
jgi:hypothetical protein